ncbi:unnamed protein product [Larinioides sclopetarius]|uniref:UNC93-like protein n=1 Tax=Larinioides sclopetarius TaxID=280406 RepID=A0AAV2B5F3_9ARAC
MEFPRLHKKSYEAVQNTAPESTKFERPKIAKNLAVLCTGTVIHFTAYDALTMLQSTMNRKDGIGVTSQAILYAFFCASAILLPKFFISKFGSKNTSVAAMCAFLPYIASNYYPHWSLMVPSSILLGIAGPLLWASHGVYLNGLSVLCSNHGEPCVEEAVTYKSSKKDARRSSGDDLTQQTYTEPNAVDDCVELKYEESKEASLLKSLKRLDFRDTAKLLSHTSNGVTDELKYDETKEASSLQSRKRLDSRNNSMIRSQTSNMISESPSSKQTYNSAVKSSSSNYQDPRINKNSNNIPFEGNSEENETKRLVIKTTSTLLSSTTAKFFGFHGMAHLTSHVWSSLLSYFTLKTDVLFVDFSNSSCRCGAEFCSVASECFEYNAGNPGANVRNILTSVCICMCFMAILIVGVFLDNLDQEKRLIYFSFDFLNATCAILKRKETLLLIPLSIHTGLVQGFYVGDFNKSYVACAWGTYHVGLVAVCYGVACGTSSLLSGWCVRHCGRRPVFTLAAVVNVVSVIFFFLWTPDSKFPKMFFFASALWGIHVGIVWSQLRAFYGVLFPSDEEAAFSAFHLWSGLGFCVAFGFSNFFCISHKLFVILAVTVLGFSGYYTVELIYCKNNKDSY